MLSIYGNISKYSNTLYVIIVLSHDFSHTSIIICVMTFIFSRGVQFVVPSEARASLELTNPLPRGHRPVC